MIGPIWGPANGVWLGIIGLLFLFIPFGWWPRLIMYFVFGAYLGFRGNEFAWRARRWPSLAHFRRVQQQWMVIALVFYLVALFTIPFIFNS